MLYARFVSTFCGPLVILGFQASRPGGAAAAHTMKKFALSSSLLVLKLLHQVNGATLAASGGAGDGDDLSDAAFAKLFIPQDGTTVAVAVLLSCFIALQLARTRHLRRRR